MIHFIELIAFISLIYKNYVSLLFLDTFLAANKKRKSYILYLYLFIITFLFLLIYKLSYPFKIISTILSVGIIFSFLNFYKDPLNKKLVYMLILLVLISTSEFLSSTLLLSFNIGINIFETNIIFTFLQTLFTGILMLIIVFIIKSIKSKEKNIQLNYLLIIFPLLSSTMLYILFLTFVNNYNKNILYLLYSIMVLLVFISNIAIILIIKYITKVELDNQNYNFLKKSYTNMKHHYEDLIQMEERIKGIRHDLKSDYLHILGLINFKKYDECKLVINNILDDITSFDNIINTGNTGLDTVLSSKISIAQAKNISISPIIILPNFDKLNIDEIDISLICANILDNAIEATTQCPKENQKIDFQISYNPSLKKLIINCKNTTVYNTLPKSTTKKNSENHGIGLKNIISISKKWKGNVSYDIKEKVFIIVVSLYCN